MNQQDAQLLTNNLYFPLFYSTCPSYSHVAVRLACAIVPNAWYSLLDGAPDDGRIVHPKHVEQNKGK